LIAIGSDLNKMKSTNIDLVHLPSSVVSVSMFKK
jgi:hypothetical protein